MILFNRVERFLEPIFIVGFHHSGTRLLARLLHKSGMFQRVNRGTYEWGYIQKLNSSLLPRWNDPEKVRTFSPDEAPFSIPRLRIALLLWLRGYRGAQPWGHKDPRTCATLSVWLRAFPKAIVAHIVRDPLDVLGTLGPAYAKFTPGGKLPQQALGFWGELWIAYNNNVLASAPKARKFVEVRYEDLCTHPQQELFRMARALNLPKDKTVDIEGIRANKIGAHKQWIVDGRLDVELLEQLKLLISNHRENYGYDV